MSDNHDRPQSTPAGTEPVNRRTALKRAGGVGIIMSSFSSGSALASISCKKFSNWMSGSGSPHLVDEDKCALGRSPGFWKNVKKGTSCSPAFNNNFRNGDCKDVLEILNTKFFSLFGSGTSQSVQQCLDSPGRNIERAFSAAYLNALYIPGYPLNTDDVMELWKKVGGPGFDEADVKEYLESTYED